MKILKNRHGVSNGVFAAAVVVLLIIAGIGYGLYATKLPSSVTTTSTATSTVTSATTTTITAAQSGSNQLGFTGGFLDNKLVTFVFYGDTPPVCQPSITKLFPNDSTAASASAATNCEMGAKGTFPSNAVPVWGLIPIFAGLSVFGIPSMGSTPDGFPTYNNHTILTDCAAITSPRSCPGHPKILYSPAFVMVQQSMGIKTGLMNLPEGVMPFPAHTHIVTTDANQQNIPWDVVSVLVFDPNIFPNPLTGVCTQTVPSALSNATANCLTSIQALQNAMTTSNSAVAQANANNPVWAAMGKPLMQVVIPGDTQPTEITNANSNMNIPFAVTDQNPYPPYFGYCPCAPSK
jgi:hypothetical protein